MRIPHGARRHPIVSSADISCRRPKRFPWHNRDLPDPGLSIVPRAPSGATQALSGSGSFILGTTQALPNGRIFPWRHAKGAPPRSGRCEGPEPPTCTVAALVEDRQTFHIGDPASCRVAVTHSCSNPFPFLPCSCSFLSLPLSPRASPDLLRFLHGSVTRHLRNVTRNLAVT